MTGVKRDHACLCAYLLKLKIKVCAIGGLDDRACLEVLLRQSLETVLYHGWQVDRIKYVDVLLIHLFPEKTFLWALHYHV